MRTKLLSLILVAVGLLALSSPAANTPTNTTPGLVESAKAITQTNFNQVLIEMLAGVKNASGEIYTASKDMIHKGVDFVSEQAPDVVRQFLTWKFFEATVKALVFLVIVAFFFYWAYRAAKYAKTANKELDTGADLFSDSGWGTILKWVCTMVAMLFLVFGVSTPVYTMVKIKVAPKVYLIEYVVDLAQGKTPNGR